MPFYAPLKRIVPPAERKRIVGNLLALKTLLDESMPDKDSEQTLIIGSWNIRDFGKPGTRRGFGAREPETLFYIAEIISRFDIVALQEVNELDELEELMRILGSSWDYIATDVTHSSLGGNGERLTYCYDKRKVTFQNIAGELVLPSDALISRSVVPTASDEKLYAGKQFRRTPFLARFQSGWFKFDICTVHLYYGAETGPELQERIEEIDRVAGYLAKVAKASLKSRKAMILLGDFNIVHPEHQTMQALTRHGFKVPKTLAKPTNYKHTKYYDQIAFMTDPAVLGYIDTIDPNPKKCNSGILDIFKVLYTPAMAAAYRGQMRKAPSGKSKSDAELDAWFDEWLTYQLSDHRPLWVRVQTNEGAAYLQALLEAADG